MSNELMDAISWMNSLSNKRALLSMLLSIFFLANVNFFFFLFLDKEYLMIVIQDPSRPWSKTFVPLCDCKYKIH